MCCLQGKAFYLGPKNMQNFFLGTNVSSSSVLCCARHENSACHKSSLLLLVCPLKLLIHGMQVAGTAATALRNHILCR